MPFTSMPARIMCLGVLSLSAVFLTACDNNNVTAVSGQVITSGEAAIGGPFTLVNQEGETITEADILGKPQLIYFGFSYCPDVCPVALQQMGQALSIVDPQGDVFTPIFISVDPERDTPDMLKTYVSNQGFPKGLQGLTGTPAQIEGVKSAYKVYAQKVTTADNPDGYTVDHVSIIYLMDKKGKFLDIFTHDTSVPDMVKRLKAHQKRI